MPSVQPPADLFDSTFDARWKQGERPSDKPAVGPLRVIVCGGRSYSDRQALVHSLALVSAVYGIATVIHGGAFGADALADDWARGQGLVVERYPADWAANGRAAGPLRNKQMLDEAEPDLVIAFPGGRGTADMVRQAKARGLPIYEAPGSFNAAVAMIEATA